MTIVTLLSKDYEPEHVVRLDSLPKKPSALPNVEDRPIYKALKEHLDDSKIVTLNWAKQIIQDQSLGSWSNDEELSTLLGQNGWTTVYTFEGV